MLFISRCAVQIRSDFPTQQLTELQVTSYRWQLRRESTRQFRLMSMFIAGKANPARNWERKSQRPRLEQQLSRKSRAEPDEFSPSAEKRRK